MLEGFDFRLHHFSGFAVAGGGLAGLFQLLVEQCELAAVEFQQCGELRFFGLPVGAFLGFEGLCIDECGDRLAQLGDGCIRFRGMEMHAG